SSVPRSSGVIRNTTPFRGATAVPLFCRPRGGSKYRRHSAPCAELVQLARVRNVDISALVDRPARSVRHGPSIVSKFVGAPTQMSVAPIRHGGCESTVSEWHVKEWPNDKIYRGKRRVRRD